MKILTKLYLYLNAAAYWAFTVFSFIMPNRLSELIGINLTSPIAVSDFRAVYGEFCLGAGILAVLGTYKEKWSSYAVFSMALFSAGLLQGRLLTIFTHGFTPSLYNTSSMVAEIVAIVLGLYLLIESDIRGTDLKRREA